MQSLAVLIDARLRDALAACGGDVVIEVTVRTARPAHGVDALEGLDLSALARRPWAGRAPAGHDFPALKRRAQVDALDAAGVGNGVKSITRWFAANWHPSLARLWGPHDNPATVKRWRTAGRRERAVHTGQEAVTVDGHSEEASLVGALPSITPAGEPRTRRHLSPKVLPAFPEVDRLRHDCGEGER